MNELATKKDVQEFSIDWNVYLKNFLRTQHLSFKSIKSYQQGVSSFLAFMREREIERPLPDDIHDYLNSLKEDEYSVFSINLYAISIKKFFAYLNKPYGQVEGKNLSVYPDIYALAKPKLKRPAKKKHYRDMPTDEEVQALRGSVKGRGQKPVRDLLMIDLGLYAALRVNEIANVKIDDLVKNGGNYKLHVLRKGMDAKNSYVLLNTGIAERIRRYTKRYKIEGYVFNDISHLGSKGHLCSTTISTIIGGYLKKAQIKRESITAHSLRHYAGTLFFRQSKDIYATQQFLGHSNPETTQIYMHCDQNYEQLNMTLAPAR